MEKITSKNNPKIVDIIKLKQKKYRKEYGQVLLEGKKVIEEAVKAGFEIETLILTEQTEILKNNFKYKNLILTTENITKTLSFAVSSQNCFAVINLNISKKQKYGNRVLILDKLQNPDNLGAITRTAVATNFKTILSVDSVDIYNEKTIRASMGNVFKINFVECDYDQIKNLLNGYEIYIADMNGKNVFEINSFSDKIALVIGNEGNGISDEMKSLANNVISIPMENSVESLNASVSAGIIMYYIKNKGE